MWREVDGFRNPHLVRQALGRIRAQVAFYERDHRHLQRPLLGIPKRGIDKGTIHQPQPVAPAGQGLGILVIIPQAPRFMATAGVDPDVFGNPGAQVIKAQQGMAIVIALPALLGRAAPEMDALGQVGAIDGPHRAISQTR